MMEIRLEEQKVTIIIPSCSSERIPMLTKTVESIQAGSYKNIHPIIVADGNPKIEREAKEKLHHVTVISNEKRKDWVFSINRVLKEFDSDYYIYASDDLFFPPDCIKYAMIKMQERFPDGFGVVSIGKKHRCAFGLFGRKFADHFPDRQVFCPDFIHYGSDSELWRTVSELGKFAFIAHRPSSVNHARLKDKTWRLARGVRGRDHGLYFEREKLGYRWGIDFKLLVKR